MEHTATCNNCGSKVYFFVDDKVDIKNHKGEEIDALCLNCKSLGATVN